VFGCVAHPVFSAVDWVKAVEEALRQAASTLNRFSVEKLPMELLWEPEVEAALGSFASAWGVVLRTRNAKYASAINQERKDLEKYAESLKEFSNTMYLARVDPVTVAMARAINAEEKDTQNLLKKESYQQRAHAGVVTLVDVAMSMSTPRMVCNRGYLLSGRDGWRMMMNDLRRYCARRAHQSGRVATNHEDPESNETRCTG